MGSNRSGFEVQTPAPSSLGKSLSLSEPWFPPLYNMGPNPLHRVTVKAEGHDLLKARRTVPGIK